MANKAYDSIISGDKNLANSLIDARAKLDIKHLKFAERFEQKEISDMLKSAATVSSYDALNHIGADLLVKENSALHDDF